MLVVLFGGDAINLHFFEGLPYSLGYWWVFPIRINMLLPFNLLLNYWIFVNRNTTQIRRPKSFELLINGWAFLIYVYFNGSVYFNEKVFSNIKGQLIWFLLDVKPRHQGELLENFSLSHQAHENMRKGGDWAWSFSLRFCSEIHLRIFVLISPPKSSAKIW